ncbi:hypothetical protein SRABI83_03735 [Arthrobacter sp. Bi83]|nr:hypothetical protein SRABI83_03735 [Arthrobacter sp. Bi83]
MRGGGRQSRVPLGPVEPGDRKIHVEGFGVEVQVHIRLRVAVPGCFRPVRCVHHWAPASSSKAARTRAGWSRWSTGRPPSANHVVGDVIHRTTSAPSQLYSSAIVFKSCMSGRTLIDPAPPHDGSTTNPGYNSWPRYRNEKSSASASFPGPRTSRTSLAVRNPNSRPTRLTALIVACTDRTSWGETSASTLSKARNRAAMVSA